jgi:hypothetical protein
MNWLLKLQKMDQPPHSGDFYEILFFLNHLEMLVKD